MFVDEKNILRKLLTPQEFTKCKEIADGDLELWEDQDLLSKLFEIYWAGDLRGDMPYDIAKAHSGTPDDWISARLEKVFAPR